MTFPCPTCYGTGTLDSTPANSPSAAKLRTCEDCSGTGLILCDQFQCSTPATANTDDGYFCDLHLPYDE